MFHVRDNLFFGRRADGSVRVLKFSLSPKDGWQGEFPRVEDQNAAALLDITIDADSWGSIVASVSARGEEHGRWYMAMDFHNGRPVRPET